MNLYTDPYAYIRAASGHDTATVIGNLVRIASPGVVVGATSITLTAPTTVAMNAYDQIVIFDGANSEVATLTDTAWQGVSTISVQALQYAHATGTPLCSDGTQGSLAAMIVNASAEIEAHCDQSLLSATYSNEKLPLRTMRAAITNDHSLMVRPRHFPVSSISALSIILDTSTSIALSTSQAILDADALLVTVPILQATSNMPVIPWTPWPPSQTMPGFVQLSYTAGYAYTALPRDVTQAAIWLTSDLLSDRRNPTGAAEIKYGDVAMKMRLARESGGGSQLTMKAYRALSNYRQRVM